MPSGQEKSLYLRPFMISTEVGLGVRPADRYEYLLIASPAGAYFPRGLKPVSVWISDDYVRAAPGGTGEAKCAGNYAASLVAQAEAAQHGCDQVVWLDAVERRWIEEMGGMNLYFVLGHGDSARLVTPELTGSLLPGITRSSLLTVAADLGIRADEGRISVDEWRDGLRQRRDHRGVRLRHGRRHHARRRGQVAHERLPGRSARAAPGPSRRGCVRPCSTSRPVRRPTRTTGCTRSAEPSMRRRRRVIAAVWQTWAVHRTAIIIH